ncbi:hypothetical protein C3Y91_32055 [Rhizobium sp. UPM1133]|nr:hypothetical protein [Rhizobium ruizarguesonis]
MIQRGTSHPRYGIIIIFVGCVTGVLFLNLAFSRPHNWNRSKLLFVSSIDLVGTNLESYRQAAE